MTDAETLSPFPKLLKKLRESQMIHTERRAFSGVVINATRPLSQSMLAERAGFDHSYVSRLESGSRTPTREAIDRLADAMSLSTNERDALLAAGGFLPNQEVIVGTDPCVRLLHDFLSDTRVSDATRRHVQRVVGSVVAAFADMALNDLPRTP